MEHRSKFGNPGWLHILRQLGILFQWLSFVFHPEEVSSEKITASSNATAFVGQRFELSCYGNKSSKWIDWTQFRTENSSQCPDAIKVSWCANIVVSGVISNSQRNRFNVSKTSNETHLSSTLSAEAIDLSYAGVYQCVDANRSSAFTFLTVIDRNPNCTIADDNNSTTLKCSFAYSGWILSSQRNPSANSSLINCTQEGRHVLCVVQTPECRVGNAALYFGALERKDSASENENDETNSINVAINIFEASFYVNLRCIGSVKLMTTASDVFIVYSTSAEALSTFNIKVISVSAVCGFVVLVIIILLIRLKCESKKTEIKPDFLAMPLNDEFPLSSDEQTTPVYSEVKKKKKKSSTEMPLYSGVKKKENKTKTHTIAHDHVIDETGIYGLQKYGWNTENSASTSGEHSQTGGTIYSELQDVWANDRPAFTIRPREGFETSDYVSVDHTSPVPALPLPPKLFPR